MLLDMKDIRNKQRALKKQAKLARKKNEKEGVCNDPDQSSGLTAYKNLFGKLDPTPAQADRLKFPELSILDETKPQILEK